MSVVKQFNCILKSGIAEGLSWLGHYILSQWCQRVSWLGKYFALRAHS